MTPNLFPLYVASVAMIGLLSLFARRNRVSGWTKPGRSIVPNLVEMQVEWAVSKPNVEMVELGAPVSVHEVSDFSIQLSRLQGALGTAEPVTNVGKGRVAVEEIVKV